MYRCMYIWLFSRSDGAGSATTRNTRGLTRSVMARMVPPLPAPSRPSNRTMTRKPFGLYPRLECTEFGLEAAKFLLVLSCASAWTHYRAVFFLFAMNYAFVLSNCSGMRIYITSLPLAWPEIRGSVDSSMK